MLPPFVATALRVLWLAVELPYLRRHRVKPARDWDRRSALLWDVANALEPFGMVLGFVGVGRMRGAGEYVGWAGVALLVLGVAVRWSAIYALGKFFTGVVLIREDHRLMRGGIYRHVRHPAYTGALVAHLGLGLSFTNWYSLAFGVVPYALAAAYRIRVEERALLAAFGDEYESYARATKRLIPKVF
ncbi:MAG: isoprenylcysteine carboxylmethyltransferase family protein [Acidobacteria bacterium]|nr:isoprenylcysteine carboxylmethyltransferase family protein [Acidobacteriota bacterium]